MLEHQVLSLVHVSGMGMGDSSSLRMVNSSLMLELALEIRLLKEFCLARWISFLYWEEISVSFILWSTEGVSLHAVSQLLLSSRKSFSSGVNHLFR